MIIQSLGSIVYKGIKTICRGCQGKTVGIALSMVLGLSNNVVLLAKVNRVGLDSKPYEAEFRAMGFAGRVFVKNSPDEVQSLHFPVDCVQFTGRQTSSAVVNSVPCGATSWRERTVFGLVSENALSITPDGASAFVFDSVTRKSFLYITMLIAGVRPMFLKLALMSIGPVVEG